MCDINVYATSNAVSRGMLEKLKQLAFENNTAGATIFDLGDVMMADSIAEVDRKMKEIEAKTNANAQLAHEREMEAINAQAEAAAREKQMDLDYKAAQAELDRQNEVLVAKIRAAGYGAMQDVNENKQNDFLDFLDREDSVSQFNQKLTLEQEKEQNKISLTRDKISVEREKILAAERMKAKDVQVAAMNKNKYDKPQPKKKK